MRPGGALQTFIDDVLMPATCGVDFVLDVRASGHNLAAQPVQRRVLGDVDRAGRGPDRLCGLLGRKPDSDAQHQLLPLSGVSR
jgi:hypothetical protein